MWAGDTLPYLSLAAGTYYLCELSAPEGYILTNPISAFEIADDTWASYGDGKLHILGLVEWDPGANEEQGGIVYTSQKNLKMTDDTTLNEVTLQTGRISNTPGVELPASGGPGTTWVYLLGTVLLLGGSITLASRRRTHRA